MKTLFNTVENIVARGAITPFVTQYFQKWSAAEASEIVYLLEKVTPNPTIGYMVASTTIYTIRDERIFYSCSTFYKTKS